MSTSDNIRKYFSMIPMVGISISIVLIIIFMFLKVPSSTESILYALIPVIVNTLVSVIAAFFYRKKKSSKKEAKSNIKILIIMFLSLVIFVTIYSQYF